MNFVGLLDTGASISCLGSSAAVNLMTLKTPVRKLNTTVKTADGKPQNIVGVLPTTIEIDAIANNFVCYS